MAPWRAKRPTPLCRRSSTSSASSARARTSWVVRLTVGSELAHDGEPHIEQRTAANFSPAVPGEIVSSPIQPGDLTGHRLWGGRRPWLRKAQFSYGWDWVEALPRHRPVARRPPRRPPARASRCPDLRLDTLPEAGQVTLELAAELENLHPWSEPCLRAGR